MDTTMDELANDGYDELMTFLVDNDNLEESMPGWISFYNDEDPMKVTATLMYLIQHMDKYNMAVFRLTEDDKLYDLRSMDGGTHAKLDARKRNYQKLRTAFQSDSRNHHAFSEFIENADAAEVADLFCYLTRGKRFFDQVDLIRCRQRADERACGTSCRGELKMIYCGDKELFDCNY